MMEMTSAVNAQETDYFVIRRQMEKAKTVAMKNFPFMQIFLLRAGQEDVPEAVETVGEMAETLLRMYETILERVDFTSLHALSPERLVKIVDYILNGLLAEMVREPDFKPDTYYKEALRYLEELEQMCVLQG